MNLTSQKPRILRLPEVMKQTGLSRSSIYSFIKQGGFPKQINLGERSSGWIENEVSDWIEKRIASSRPHQTTPSP